MQDRKTPCEGRVAAAVWRRAGPVLGFAAAILAVAALAPWALERAIVPYPPALLVVLVPLVGVFSLATAVPVWLWLRQRGRAGPSQLAIAGFLCGFGTCAAFRWMSKPQHSQVGPDVLVEHGALTAQGWIDLLLTSALMGVAGAVGAGVFMLVLALVAGARALPGRA